MKIGDYQTHPAANVFALLKGDDFDALVEDIRKNGLHEPIWLIAGKDKRKQLILDGRNRLRACLKAKVTPRFRTYTGDSPMAFVWSLNAARRHLDKSQEALAAGKALPLFKAEAKARQGRAGQARNVPANLPERSDAGDARDAAAGPNVSGRSVQHAATVLEQAVPAVIKLVEDGKLAVSLAASITKLPDGGQRWIAKHITDGAKPTDAVREYKRKTARRKLNSVSTRKAKAALGVYDVLVIDPPWEMEKIERDERPNQSEMDYPTMSEEQLAALKIPAATNAHVWVWTTHRFLPMAFRLLDAWNLKYVCTFVWHKPGGFQPIGLPQYNCEFALYCRRGSPEFLDTKALPVCFDAPRGKHSEKPDAFYDVVRRVTAGRRLDMFNRRKISGFASWGNEAS